MRDLATRKQKTKPCILKALFDFRTVLYTVNLKTRSSNT